MIENFEEKNDQVRLGTNFKNQNDTLGAREKESNRDLKHLLETDFNIVLTSVSDENQSCRSLSSEY